jgi:hypothetical protein
MPFSAKEYEMMKRYSHLVPDTLKKAVDDAFEGWQGEDINKKKSDKD